MDKYLLQILLETKTIIIPGLGALTITNEETGEIMFMSYLKYDDGALAKHIAEKENISENDAKNIISKYVSEIETKLSQGNEYEMFEFGKFFMKDGEIEFETWKSLTNSATIQDEKPEVIEPVIVAETINETIMEVPSQEDEMVHQEDKSLEEILSKTLATDEEYVPTEEIVEPTISKENSYTPPTKGIDAVDEDDISEDPQPIISERSVESSGVQEVESAEPQVIVVKNKRKPVFWLLVALIGILLALAIGTIFFYDQMKQYFPFMESPRTEVERNKANPEEISEDLNESAEVYENNEMEGQDQLIDEEPVAEEVEDKESESATPVQAPTSSSMLVNGSGNYYVIVGAFGEKGNADRQVEKLTAAGNQSRIVGQYDGLYLVAIGSYNSESEAKQAISNHSEYKGWIFHKR